jgi:aspartate carbamoyltransferase
MLLYQKARELKDAIRIRDEGAIAKFRLQDAQAAAYLIFMEDSTRTKESFRNAAGFHGLKVNVFDSSTSSFQKSETITDTLKMLVGYSYGPSIFIIRSKIEGVCRWLEESMAAYTNTSGLPLPSFLNAGDGKHEHPTQEFLDEFSFLEHNNWDTSSIHLAVIGDLYHGRTVHSKADGLRIYDNVEVDCIAPDVLGLPSAYEERMLTAGFKVRKFQSLDEYLAQPKVAKIWYFTRLQLERMGEDVQSRALALNAAVTFRREFVAQLPEGTRFFHPLPRDSRHPNPPFWLDDTPLNAWDQQSRNGYFTRIVLLGMVGGSIGGDFSPPPPRQLPDRLLVGEDTDWVNIEPKLPKTVEAAADGSYVKIDNGVILSGICRGEPIAEIWRRLPWLHAVLDPGKEHRGQQLVRNLPGSSESEGVVALYGFEGERRAPSEDGADVASLVGIEGASLACFGGDLSDRNLLRKLAALAPGSTLSVVVGGNTARRIPLGAPPRRIRGLADTVCANTMCISRSENGQRDVPPCFERAEGARRRKLRREASAGETSNTLRASEDWVFVCRYCEWRHAYTEIWKLNNFGGVSY